ncbi:hypothetical protein JCM10212_003768 [Sporobolomyces blumeae]
MRDFATMRFQRFARPATSTSPVALLCSRVRSVSTATVSPPSSPEPDSPTVSTPTSSSSPGARDGVPPEPRMTTPIVSKYLFVVAGMVFAIVIVGGMTRLTESGLSITEWNVIKGTMLPIRQQDWEEEFEKYKLTPEWQINNQHITLEDFKRIYLWEWSHRILGRVIGLSFVLPIPYFLWKRQLSRTVLLPLFGIATLIGGQGALGWYMVKSGLDAESVQDLGGVPRVSQYRLAAHLGMAFCVYALCLRMGLGVARDWKLVHRAQGLAGWTGVEQTLQGLRNPVVARTRVAVTALSGLVFLTALSGAFVAGLDAGLIYNEWPLMGGSLHTSDRWRNLFENPTTAQFDQRMLAYTTFLSVVTLFAVARRPHVRAHLPPTTFRLIKATVFLTALSGALVAGLDAGLINNEWPLMGGSLHPPWYELNKDFYCRKADKSDRWRNLFENPTTAQFDHRMLAYTTFLSVVSLFAYARRPHVRAHLPPTTFRLIKASLHMSLLQVALGISTLLYLVPVPLAATHQAGSLVLLSLVLATGATIRRPGRVAQEVLKVRRIRNKASQL